VINAAGAWLHQIGSMVGVTLPIAPLLTSRFVTEPVADVPSDLPLLIFTDYYDLYIREQDGGLLIGAYDEGVSGKRRVLLDAPADLADLPTDLARQALRLARDFSPTVPLLGSVRVREMCSGLPTYTADGRHLLGAIDSVPGFFVAGGDNEAGVTHAPGLGRLIADLVVDGCTDQDISAYRLDRLPTSPTSWRSCPRRSRLSPQGPDMQYKGLGPRDVLRRPASIARESDPGSAKTEGCRRGLVVRWCHRSATSRGDLMRRRPAIREHA